MFYFKRKKKSPVGDNDSSEYDNRSVHYLPLPLKKKKGVKYREHDGYAILKLHNGDVYYSSEYVGYDSGDEDGFGMEDEYDYHFFDSKKRYIGTLSAWSERDFSLNKDRISWFLDKELTRRNN